MAWHVISASVRGQSHIEGNTPCQDRCAHKMIDENCGIAIISDGAGSCKHSHTGADFVVQNGIIMFEALVNKYKWHDLLPPGEIWREEAIHTLSGLVDKLASYAKTEEISIKSLSSTFIVAVFSPRGIRAMNVGDGRGAIKTTNNEWKSIVKPFHGEQVGMTWFLSSPEIWENENSLIHTQVSEEEITAFVILSDGVEKFTFECYARDKSGRYYDPNRPFPPVLDFFVEKTGESLLEQSPDQVKKKWERFLKNGHERLSKETDDKTIIIGSFKAE